MDESIYVSADAAMERWVSTSEAAERLGVQPSTIYAYVSRGLLHSRRNGRTSLFDLREVDRLKRRTNRQHSGTGLGPTDVSFIDGDNLSYRGTDVRALCRTHTIEEVATLLWTGRLVSDGPWTADARMLEAAKSVQMQLPGDTLPLERLQIIIPIARLADPLRYDLNASSIQVAGKGLMATMVDALPHMVQSADRPDQRLAARLWPRLSAEDPTPDTVQLLDTAMIVMADHHLAVSTLAARAAAAARADPYSVVVAGMAAASGALHGGASLAIEDLLSEIGCVQTALGHLGQRLRRGDQLIGLGHVQYSAGDPRASVLLEALAEACGRSEEWDGVKAILNTVKSRGLPPPNVDFALAALSHVLRLRRGAGEAIYVIARTAGWLAHALEQYEHSVAHTGLSQADPGTA